MQSCKFFYVKLASNCSQNRKNYFLIKKVHSTMSIFRKQETEMKMDTYINGFCSSAKSEIAQSKYQDVIQSTEKFIQRQARNFLTFSRDSVIQLLYLETYCCHQIILKLVLNNTCQSTFYQIKQTIKIMIRNLKKSVYLIADFLENRQVIVNFGSPNLNKNKYSVYRNQNNSEISKKSFSCFLETAVWLIKDTTILLNLKKSVTLKTQLLEVAVKFMTHIADTIKRKKIRHRANQLEVKCLFIVFLFQSKQYQRGYSYTQTTITQLYQFLFHLNHELEKRDKRKAQKYKRVLKKSYKLLFIVLIYQAYFHINLNSFHSLEALLSIIRKLQTLQGPRQLIRYYHPYEQIMKIMTIIVQVHEQFTSYFGNGQIYSESVIFNIIQNSDKIAVKTQNLQKKSTNHKKNVSLLKRANLSTCKKQKSMIERGSQLNCLNIKSSVDFVVEEKKRNRLGRISQILCEENHGIKQRNYKIMNTCKNIQKSNSFAVDKRIIKAKHFNSEFCKRQSGFSQNFSILEDSTQNNGFTQNGTPLNSCIDINKQQLVDKYKRNSEAKSNLKSARKSFKNRISDDLYKLTQQKFVAASQMIMEQNLKKKKSQLLNRIALNRNTHQFFKLDQYENEGQINVDDQFKTLCNALKQTEQTRKQTQQDSYNNIHSYQSSKKMISLHKIQSKSPHMQKKRPKKIGQNSYNFNFSQTNRQAHVASTQNLIQMMQSQIKSKNIYQHLIRILLKNRFKLSIQMFANKVEMHLKKQEMKKIKLIKQSKQKMGDTVERKGENRYHSMYGKYNCKNKNQNLTHQFSKQKNEKYLNGHRNPKKMKSLNLQPKQGQNQKQNNVNFGEVLQEIDLQGKKKYHIVRRQSFGKSKQKQGKQNRKDKQQEGKKFKQIMNNQQRTLRNKRYTPEGQMNMVRYKTAKYVGKYQRVCNQLKPPSGVSEQQFEKMLKYCYIKSRQSIQDVTRKIILQQKGCQQKSIRKRGLIRSDSFYA